MYADYMFNNTYIVMCFGISIILDVYLYIICMATGTIT